MNFKYTNIETICKCKNYIFILFKKKTLKVQLMSFSYINEATIGKQTIGKFHLYNVEAMRKFKMSKKKYFEFFYSSS